LEIVHKATVNSRRLAVLPGSFNPPTRAHLGLAEAALAHADEVLFAIPRVFPHKEYFGASLAERIEMIKAIVPPGGSVGISERGLFIDIARELGALYPGVELSFVCGRDAAERIISWRYEEEQIEDILQELRLLVADRDGDFVLPVKFAGVVKKLQCERFDEISSTAVRDRILRGEMWEHLVPGEIVATVRQIYSAR
jgi:nicotinate (nicotinamide) nucleotide adenylyltransferase